MNNIKRFTRRFAIPFMLAGGLLAPHAVVGALTPEVPGDAAETAVKLGDAFASIVDRCKGAVVSVLSEKVVTLRSDHSPFPFNDPFFRQFFGGSPNQTPGRIPVAGLGSGFVLDEQGHVLTNDHVVRGMEKIHVMFPDKRSVEAKVIGSDSKTDIAVLQIVGKVPPDITAVRLGNSDDLHAGNLVLAFGAPFGLTQTVTSGIISATGRSQVGIADFEDFLQTDAPINPGNSGGPLINMHGEVIGINTAIATQVGQSAGVGFAIPINMAKGILPTLLQGRKVVRGMLGIGVQDVTPELAKEFNLSNTKGALVSQVNPDSPGDKAGLKSGDVIVEFAGKPITDANQLRELVASHAPGSSEQIKLLRNGHEVSMAARLGELGGGPAEAVAAAGTLQKFGIEAKNITPDLSSEYDVKAKKGVVITNVDPTSPAGMAGVRPGDVITEVDRKKVDNLGKVDQILAQKGKPDEVLLLVNHKGESVYVTLETG